MENDLLCIYLIINDKSEPEQITKTLNSIFYTMKRLQYRVFVSNTTVDKSKQISQIQHISEWGNNHTSVRLSHNTHPWKDDFSECRNEVIEYISYFFNPQYILQLECGEVLEEFPTKFHLTSSAYYGKMKVQQGGIEVITSKIRLFKNIKFSYVFPVNEQLYHQNKKVREDTKFLPNFVISSVQHNASQVVYSVNDKIILFEKWLDRTSPFPEMKEHIFVGIYTLANLYLDSYYTSIDTETANLMRKKAIDNFKKLDEFENIDTDDVLIHSKYQLARLYFTFQTDEYDDKAIMLLTRLYMKHNRIEPMVQLAKYFLMNGSFLLAYLYSSVAVSIEIPKQQYIGYDQQMYTFERYLIYAQVTQIMKYFDECKYALDQVEKVKLTKPQQELVDQVRKNLVLSQNRTVVVKN